MKERQFRGKITWLIFGLSLFVVWVHSYNAELYLGRTAAAATLYRWEHWIGDGIGQMAVPGFFMISGYLFYRKFSWDRLMEKWNSRIHSILVPFMLWNFIYYLGYVIASRLPWMSDVVGKGVIPLSLSSAVDAVINYTYNYVFWYLYQLILLILLAPVLYQILKKSWSGIGFQLLIWCLLVFEAEIPELNLDALAYYCLAAYLALHKNQRVERAWNVPRGVVGLGLVTGAAAVFWFGLWQAMTVFFVVSRVMAVMGLWLLLPEKILPEPKGFVTYNFFLYATHFAFVRFINKAGREVLPHTQEVAFGLYLLMPILVLVISSVLGSALRRWTPSLWRLLNGGR